jgi:pimeloyl-ACP methyl ester carboxylesterase
VDAPAVETIPSTDGTPIGCWRTGDGPPLVLVHGTAADHARWAPVLPALERSFTVLAVDRRGRGASGDADGYAIEREFEDLAAVVDWAGPGTSVLGHSYGAVCALEGALLTDRLRALVLYEPPVGVQVASAEVVARLEALLGADQRDELVAVFMTEVAGVLPDQVEGMRAHPSWAARLAAAHTIPRELRAHGEYGFDAPRFRQLEVTTLLLRGGDSLPGFTAATETVAAALPDGRIVTMPGQRHTAMDTGTELFTTEVLGFLGATPAP